MWSALPLMPTSFVSEGPAAAALPMHTILMAELSDLGRVSSDDMARALFRARFHRRLGAWSPRRRGVQSTVVVDEAGAPYPSLDVQADALSQHRQRLAMSIGEWPRINFGIALCCRRTPYISWTSNPSKLSSTISLAFLARPRRSHIRMLVGRGPRALLRAGRFSRCTARSLPVLPSPVQ